jgi:hypothetical protein
MPFEQPPQKLVEYMQVYVVTRRGSKNSCGFASKAEADGEADTQRMNGQAVKHSTRWISRKAWDDTPVFEGY